MTESSYILNPFVTFIESHLHPDPSRYAVFHRLTGQVVELWPTVRSLLQAVKIGSTVSLKVEDLSQLGEEGHQIRRLIDEEFFIPNDHDVLSSLVDHYVVRPLQNPAVTYRSESGEVLLVSLAMAERIFSPESQRLPPVVEEKMSQLANELFLAADGTRTLSQIYATFQRENEPLLEDQEFRLAIEFLTAPERQLVKFTPTVEHSSDPFQPANIVPRNFYHASRWTQHDAGRSIADFHIQGIDDAIWEFDMAEPTVNHALRFPTELLGGLDYGSRFCDAVLKWGVLPARSSDGALEILEVGGGTGSFARSFIARAHANFGELSYQVMDLSPALAESQRRILGDVRPAVGYIAQDATQFELPGQKFDLIIANEVIADFPVATIERRSTEKDAGQFAGEGAVYLKQYGLSMADAPERFYVNAGVFRFLERVWMHLAPGGALIVSEYGSQSRYPTEAFHLNHSEFSIHFGHVTECARKIGFHCRLETLKDFLGIDDRTPVLNGREEHIRCLSHVFEKHGMILPFALFSERDFNARFGDLPARIHLDPVRFLPLSSKFHYGPSVDDFLVLIMNKPSI